MKRALKIIIPALLTIAVICSIGWYLLKYDPDFTRDMLVSQARSFDEQGNHSLATWLYNLAYRQSGNDEAVAIELANQYCSMGNYTKAEYTLSNAIADGGTVELYIALCSTYVEQDKLLDAVTMLDNVSNPAIKQQLDALRPQAVTATPDHGYYNEYISVTLSVPDGTIYATTDGTYPSTAHSPYAAPIALPAGETTIRALNIDENGLVSPLTILDYTITGVIEEVTLTDPAINSAVRQTLQVDDEHILYSNELWAITGLVVPSDAQSLSDLSKLPFLNRVTIHNSKLENLSPLSALTALEELIITDSTVSDEDLQVIASLPKLTKLTLTGCSLSNISALSRLTNLTYLDLGSNTIRDLTALENMGKLTYLSLTHNAVTELNSLSGLTKLTALDLSYNSIVSTAPLAGCKDLQILDLTRNNLTALEGLDQIKQLQALSVAFNKLTEVDMLAANTSITVLDISNNEITDITALKTLNALENLNFSYNQVTALPTFSQDCDLVTIKGSQNQLSSINELAGLQNLNYVMMDYNAELTSIGALSTCYMLVEVSVYGTKVVDATALTDMNVIVKYAPVMG
jgi:Leucine-rich repeat (LRR) protein